MIWNSLEQFLQMGGYGFYVWSSLGVTMAFMGGELIALRQRRKAAIRHVARVAGLRRGRNKNESAQ